MQQESNPVRISLLDSDFFAFNTHVPEYGGLLSKTFINQEATGVAQAIQYEEVFPDSAHKAHYSLDLISNFAPPTRAP